MPARIWVAEPFYGPTSTWLASKVIPVLIAYHRIHIFGRFKCIFSPLGHACWCGQSRANLNVGARSRVIG